MHPFLVHILSNPEVQCALLGTSVDDSCGDEPERKRQSANPAVVRKELQDELGRVSRLKGLGRDQFADDVLGETWRFKLKPIPPPPPFPVKELPPSDPEYQKVLARIPQNLQPAVASIRKPHVQTRIAEFNAAYVS